MSRNFLTVQWRGRQRLTLNILSSSFKTYHHGGHRRVIWCLITFSSSPTKSPKILQSWRANIPKRKGSYWISFKNYHSNLRKFCICVINQGKKRIVPTFRNYSVGRPKAVLHFQCGLISQVLYYSLCIRNLSFSPSVLLCWKKIPFSVFCSNRGHLKCDDLFFTASKSDRSNGGGNSKESKNRRVEIRDSVILDLRPYNPLTSHLLSQSYIYPASNGLTQTDRGMYTQIEHGLCSYISKIQ